MERLLRIATWVAAALLFIGLMLWLGGWPRAEALLHGGLWLLISTPIARVLLALRHYVKERDRTFAAITLIVLACLIFPLATYFLLSPR